MRFVLALALLVGCDQAETPIEAPPPPRAQQAAPEPVERAPARCGADEAWEGGEILEAPDGARIYYRVAGPADAPAVLYLHGGPGGNAYSFERTAGARLEQALRVIYVDQRGCGRSAGGPADLALGLDPTIEDLERLRAHAGVERWSLIAHAFGGLVALVYASRHPTAIEKLVMIETTGDLEASLQHQVRALADGTTQEMAEIAAEARPAMERLIDMYTTLGRIPTQRRLHWASDEAQRAGERWDRSARLGECSREGVLPSYRAGGWLEPHPELMSAPGKPTLLIAGRHSHVLGEELVARTRDGWEAQLLWMEESGHFPFIDEPEPFANAVIEFIREPARRR